MGGFLLIVRKIRIEMINGSTTSSRAGIFMLLPPYSISQLPLDNITELIIFGE